MEAEEEGVGMEEDGIEEGDEQGEQKKNRWKRRMKQWRKKRSERTIGWGKWGGEEDLGMVEEVDVEVE